MPSQDAHKRLWLSDHINTNAAAGWIAPAGELAEGIFSRHGRGSGAGTIHGSRGVSLAFAGPGFACARHTARYVQCSSAPAKAPRCCWQEAPSASTPT